MQTYTIYKNDIAYPDNMIGIFSTLEDLYKFLLLEYSSIYPFFQPMSYVSEKIDRGANNIIIYFRNNLLLSIRV
jgi:hypothetical protein